MVDLALMLVVLAFIVTMLWAVLEVKYLSAKLESIERCVRILVVRTDKEGRNDGTD